VTFLDLLERSSGVSVAVGGEELNSKINGGPGWYTISNSEDAGGL
jgi:hypothetical protein